MIVRLAERPRDGALYPWHVMSQAKAYWDEAIHITNVAEGFGVAVSEVALRDVVTEIPDAIVPLKPGRRVLLPGDSKERIVLSAPPPPQVQKTTEQRVSEIEAALKKGGLL